METTDQNLSPPQLPAFRPSYQGWKPTGSVPQATINLLLDLPIRDGNSSLATPRPVVLALLDLPIRDGNACSSSADFTGLLLLDLPIRDGNSGPRTPAE